MLSEYLSAFLSTVFSIPSLVIIFLVIVIRIAVSTAWYKKFFAKMESNSAQLMKGIMAPLKQKIFVELGHHLKEVEGDVLEIGIGAGENFDLYPEETSLIAVDSNPHVEELLMENLKKAGERVHLKKFVVASAEDMSCSLGKPGVEDNSVAAVVCTMVLCSLTDEQTMKTLAEVKRVLMPVSSIIARASPPPLPQGGSLNEVYTGRLLSCDPNPYHFNTPFWTEEVLLPYRVFSLSRNENINQSFNIPPGNPPCTPRTFDFFENYCSNSSLSGPKYRSNAPH